jgi:hypothetical protein
MDALPYKYLVDFLEQMTLRHSRLKNLAAASLLLSAPMLLLQADAAKAFVLVGDNTGSLPCTLTGCDSSSLADLYEFFVDTSTQYNLSLRGADTGEGTLSDPFLYLYEGGTLLAYNDDGDVPLNSLISGFTLNAGTTYTAVASGYLDYTGSYVLEVTASQGVGNAFLGQAPSTSSVPGPLPVFGAVAAFGYSRKLRKHIKASKVSVASAIN